MGTYINIGNAGFQSARNSEYVDRSGLIAVVNGTLYTKRRFSCVTRCRRFGKSMAAEMLCAYYDQSCDSRSLFSDLEISHDPLFEKHLNKYPVIYLDMSDFVCSSFWASTGAYDAVARYIQMNYEGLKDDIIYMLAGGRCKVNPTKFQNDMSIIRSKDDVLTVLIHLGYLSYSWEKSARGVDAAHDERLRVGEHSSGMHTSILSCNNENSLACVLSLAYYNARNEYIFLRELPTGKGFADLVLIPRKHVSSPAIMRRKTRHISAI